MNMDEDLQMNGEVSIVVTGPDGVVKQEIVVPNKVVATGKTYIASRMSTSPAGVMTHMAIGQSSTAPTDGDTGLIDGLAGRSTITFVAVGATVTAVASFAAGIASGSITEAGIFDASSGGNMLCRTVFPVVTKEAGDSIAITWAITVSST